MIAVEFQGDDVWIGTGHGLARGIGTGFYDGLSKPVMTEAGEVQQ